MTENRGMDTIEVQEIPGELNNLSINLSRLEDRVTEVGSRLEPILTSDQPSDNKVSEKDHQTETQIGSTVRNFRDRVASVCVHLESILHRLGV